MANQSIYPLFRYNRKLDLTVMFTCHDTATVLVQGKYHCAVGTVKTGILPHDDPRWEPCADPRQSQRVNKMLKHIKDN